MKQRRMLPLLLALCLVCALLPLRASAAGVIEVHSLDELTRALADTPAKPMGARGDGKAPVRVLVLEPSLPDTCGAQRVLHDTETGEYLLEFGSRADAEAAHETLTQTYGLSRCWLDTPEQGAHVLSGASVMQANNWGESVMHLTSYRTDAHVRAHFNTGSPIIAIIDTGVDPNAENLMARSYKSYDFVHQTAVMSDVSSDGDARGHGTCVASILDAMLPENVRFMYLRVFDEDQSAARENVRLALRYAAQEGADVINLSLGWEDDTNTSYTFLDDVLQTANAAGATMVCAAGNARQYADHCYPASSAYTIAVSAVNQDLNYEVYSNYGEKVDFCAPGSGIYATTLGGAMIRCKGTSFSAPHITAAAAELKIIEPAATPARIYQLLRSYAKDLGITGKDNLYGWGIPILPENWSGLIRHIWDGGRLARAATATRIGERVYTCIVCGERRSVTISATGGSTDSGFADVPSAEYYAAPVTWATANGITLGTSDTTFEPDSGCNRAQVVTFLWRAAGSPLPNTRTSRFVDVTPGAYYYSAVLWAVEQGITVGTSDATFSPDAPCTRAQVVTFLHRFHQAGAGDATLGKRSAASGGAARFSDVPADAWYAESVAWAVENGITFGVGGGRFDPDGACTRGQVVTFLYRYAGGAE